MKAQIFIFNRYIFNEGTIIYYLSFVPLYFPKNDVNVSQLLRFVMSICI